MRWMLVATFVVAGMCPTFLAAQENGDAPLGDLARSLRKKTPPSQEVIDNDNLSHVMDQVQAHRLSGASLLFSIDGAGKSFQVSSPDVTCSLSFTANARALLSSQYVQLDLPAEEIGKLEGPATIEGDSLQVSVFNGTDWHVSEVAVALTLVKRTDARNASGFGPAKLLPAAADSPVQEPQPEKHSEKRPDLTVVYHMRAAAIPSATTVFRAPLNLEIGPDQEWHWAIVQAKGYPPQRPATQTSASSAQMPAESAPLPTAQENPQSSSAVPSPPAPDASIR
jgi:hypothetical protein